MLGPECLAILTREFPPKTFDLGPMRLPLSLQVFENTGHLCKLQRKFDASQRGGLNTLDEPRFARHQKSVQSLRATTRDQSSLSILLFSYRYVTIHLLFAPRFLLLASCGLGFAGRFLDPIELIKQAAIGNVGVGESHPNYFEQLQHLRRRPKPQFRPVVEIGSDGHTEPIFARRPLFSRRREQRTHPTAVQPVDLRRRLEVTPKSIRLRKKILQANRRK